MAEYIPDSDALTGTTYPGGSTRSSDTYAAGGVPGRTTRRSVPGLLRELVDDVVVLATKEVQLAKAEVGESIARAKAGLVSLAGGGAVLFLGLQLLLVAVAVFLAQYVAVWLAFLIVGAVTLIIGLVMVMAGKKRMEAESFVPERTIQSVQRDQKMVKEKLS